MKFRSPSETPIHVGLTSGHTAVIPPEGVELAAMFHREAIARGAIPGSLTPEEALLLSNATQQQAPQFDRKAKIAETLNAMLEGSNEGDFNGDGKPNMAAVNKRLGFQATRSEVDAVWAEVSSETDPE